MPSLRYFYLISFLVLAAGFSIVALLSFSYVENRILQATASTTAGASVEQFKHTIWRKYRKPLAYLPCDRRCPKTGNLTQEFADFKKTLKQNGIITFRLFNENAIETLNKTNTFASYHPSPAAEKLFTTTKRGKAHSEIITDYMVDGESRIVLRALMPLKPLFTIDNRSQTGNSVVEVVYDITPLWAQPSQLIYIVIGAFITILVLLFSVMYIMTSKAEHALAKQHETNVDLATAAASAEKESKEKSQFLANVSHELRTPLNAIIGFSEIIKDEVMGPLNNQQYKDYINDIYISGVHLLSLINDILDYSKAEAGKLTVDLADVDVTKIMKNSLRLVTPRANEAGVELIGEIPKKHYILHTDGKRLKQVLLNLFSNAVKFTPGNGTVTLYAWHNLTENMFVMEVKDTGVGIAPKDISKVMATFGQVENKLSRKYEGTGLGLPLSNKLVELMGGKLDIKSELGAGTTVAISLPYIEEQGTGTYNEMDALKGHDISAPEVKSNPAPASYNDAAVDAIIAPPPATDEPSPNQTQPQNKAEEPATATAHLSTPAAAQTQAEHAHPHPADVTTQPAPAAAPTAQSMQAASPPQAAAQPATTEQAPAAAPATVTTETKPLQRTSIDIPSSFSDIPERNVEHNVPLSRDSLSPVPAEPFTNAPTPPAKAPATAANPQDKISTDTPAQSEPEPIIMRGAIDDTPATEMPSSFSDVPDLAERNNTAKPTSAGNSPTTDDVDNGKNQAKTSANTQTDTSSGNQQ